VIDRIVVVNDLAEPKGGATALALASALAFRERGYPVTFLTGDTGDNAALRAAGVEVVALGAARLKGRSFVSALVGGLYNRDAERMVAGWIASHDTPNTVYHLHGWAQILSPSVFAALEPVRERLVLSAHDFFLVCPNGAFAFLKTGKVCDLVPLSAACIVSSCDRKNYAQKLWRVARETIQRSLYRPGSSPPVLAIHEAMRPFLMRGGIPDSAIETLPNPVIPFSAERIRAEDNCEALFVGRLERTKGPDLAAAACRAAGVTLRLVGDGELRDEIARDYPEAVLVGRLPPEEIAAEAARARFLVMPSRYPEPYGLVAAEALWSGLPVIAADTAFLTRDIEAAGTGLGVEPRDTDAFAAAIRTIVKDNETAKRMSIAAYERTRDIALTPNAWVNRLLAAYRARF
jgi:glycosyltransferase involved in cell wall biosynthesis